MKHLNGFVKEHNNTPRFNRIDAHISFRIEPEWLILDFFHRKNKMFESRKIPWLCYFALENSLIFNL